MTTSFPQTGSWYLASLFTFALTLLSALSSSATAEANERLFTYIYETPVLNKGDMELEPWMTNLIGRDSFYFRMDSRLEFEVGLGNGVMTAIYLNHRAEAVDDGAGGLNRSSYFRGFSNEWKFSFSDPVADPLGFAAYFEWGLQPHEVEIEAKALIDKAFGPALLGVNIVGEVEIKPQPQARPEIEGKLIVLAGISFQLHRHINLGVEIREMNVFEHGDLELALLSAGPALSIQGERLWFTMTLLPQIVDLAAGGHNTTSAEWIETRMLVGFHL